MTEVATVERLVARDSIGRVKSPGRPVKNRATGRKTGYKPEIGKAICKEIAKSVPFSLACRCLGISEETARGWNEKGISDPKSIYGPFSRNVERARGYAVRRRMKRIDKSAIGGQVIAETTIEKANGETTTTKKLLAPQWQADKWLLEVTEREAFGPRSTVETIGNDRAIAINATIQAPDLTALAGMLQRVLGIAPAPIILEATREPSGKSLASPLDSLDATADPIGNGNVLQSVAPCGGNLAIPAAETTHETVETV